MKSLITISFLFSFTAFANEHQNTLFKIGEVKVAPVTILQGSSFTPVPRQVTNAAAYKAIGTGLGTALSPTSQTASAPTTTIAAYPPPAVVPPKTDSKPAEPAKGSPETGAAAAKEDQQQAEQQAQQQAQQNAQQQADIDRLNNRIRNLESSNDRASTAELEKVKKQRDTLVAITGLKEKMAKALEVPKNFNELSPEDRKNLNAKNLKDFNEAAGQFAALVNSSDPDVRAAVVPNLPDMARFAKENAAKHAALKEAVEKDAKAEQPSEPAPVA